MAASARNIFSFYPKTRNFAQNFLGSTFLVVFKYPDKKNFFTPEASPPPSFIVRGIKKVFGYRFLYRLYV